MDSSTGRSVQSNQRERTTLKHGTRRASKALPSKEAVLQRRRVCSSLTPRNPTPQLQRSLPKTRSLPQVILRPHFDLLQRGQVLDDALGEGNERIPPDAELSEPRAVPQHEGSFAAAAKALARIAVVAYNQLLQVTHSDELSSSDRPEASIAHRQLSEHGEPLEIECRDLLIREAVTERQLLNKTRNEILAMTTRNRKSLLDWVVIYPLPIVQNTPIAIIVSTASPSPSLE